MARTVSMQLIELMIHKRDISFVLEYLGKKGDFQFQSHIDDEKAAETSEESRAFDSLQDIRSYLHIEDLETFVEGASLPTEGEVARVQELSVSVRDLREREVGAKEAKQRLEETYQEALSFSNLKLPYSELEYLSFLSIRIGKIDPAAIDSLSFSLGDRGLIIPLGEDKTRILAAASKKGRFALDAELKRAGFVPLEIPE
ncbi:MAG TPA: ATPase, partial [Treponemataceae bacterium]|nr:ATPase [Treponemataceae bacterium]